MRTALLAFAIAATASAQVTRTDFFVQEDRDICLHVRQVVASSSSNVPVLLIHGARVPGVPSFDLPHASLAESLTQGGHPVFMMDVRGYGGSTRPAEMERDPASSPPLVRTNDAARDIDAVVDEILRRTKSKRIALFGWATGGQWAGYYSTTHAEKVSHLIVLNALYGADAPQPFIGRGSDLEDRAHPGRLSPSVPGYRCNSAESLTAMWDKTIPVEDKSAWRDPQVANEYVSEALKSDPKSETARCMRSPNGALEDSFYMATGRQLYDASLLTMPVLMIGTEYDFWSRAADRERFLQHATRSPRATVSVIPGATHFVHLDRAEHGRGRLLQETLSFLAE